MKVNPNPESQKNRKNQRSFSLPIELRKKGIITQRELVMALLPYMEWVRYENLRTVFWKYITTQCNDGPLRSILFTLHKQGYIEKKYEGTPPSTAAFVRDQGYLYIRRTAKSLPRNGFHVERKADGTFGIDAERIRAARAKRGEPNFKTDVTKLTMDDVKFIKAKHGDLTLEARSEMFNISKAMVQKIAAGHIPRHLKEKRARSLL